MLDIFGRPSSSHCDRRARRHFLKIGGLGLGGLSLPQILHAQETAPLVKNRSLGHKAVIMIYLSGGPSHQDMYDLKMDAPVEIRGTFQPIATNVNGIQICEHMPRLAQMMDKVAIIRSLHGCPDQHASDLCMSGYPIGANGRQDNHPSLGSAVAKLQGAVDPATATPASLAFLAPHMLRFNLTAKGWLICVWRESVSNDCAIGGHSCKVSTSTVAKSMCMRGTAPRTS
jgi:hypothetical protein